MRRATIAATALLCVALGQGPAHAGGFSNADFGVRRMGMFAVVGYPDDLTAIFHNPAGLVLSDGTVFYHSQSWFFSELGFRLYDTQGRLRPDHEINPDWSIGAIPFIGMATDFGTERFHFGTAVYAPNAYGAALPDDEPTRYHVTRALFLASRWTTTGAFEVNDRFAIAASFNLIHVFLMADRILNLAVLDNPDARFRPAADTQAGDIGMSLDGQDLTWSLDLGVLFRPTDNLRIGASFAGGSPVSLEGNVDLSYPNGTKEHARHTTEMTIPFTLRGGVNWEFVKDFELAADVRMWHYQVFQEQRTRLSHPITDINLEEFRDPKNYENSYNWCVGLLHRVVPSVDLMVGYQQDYTPIPEETFTLDNPSRDQHGVSVGLRWRVTPDLRLGVAFVRNWFDLVDVQTSISNPPSNARGHGANSEVGLDVYWRL